MGDVNTNIRMTDTERGSVYVVNISVRRSERHILTGQDSNGYHLYKLTKQMTQNSNPNRAITFCLMKE